VVRIIRKIRHEEALGPTYAQSIDNRVQIAVKAVMLSASQRMFKQIEGSGRWRSRGVLPG
jgi:hypothetical protein